MNDPQAGLYKMLAESRLRTQHMQTMHQQRIESIPNRQKGMIEEMNQLREMIEQGGIGTDPKSEDRYLQLLEDIDYLGQSWDMAQLKKAPDSAPEIPDDLQKAIAYGTLVLQIYKNGALVKGLGADVGAIAAKLTGTGYKQADEVAIRLLTLDG